MKMGIFYLQWHITNKCNNRCLHCYHDTYTDVESLSFDEAKDIVFDFIRTCEILSSRPVISITGGDPLLHERFIDIVRLCVSECYQVNILCNPEGVVCESVINIDEIKNLNINRWQFSLDGLEKTHDYFRYAGSFDITIKAIQLLIEMNMQVSVHTTVSKFNYKEIPDLIDYLYSLGVCSWDFSRYIPNDGSCGFSPCEYRDFLLTINLILSRQNKHKSEYLYKEPLFSIINDLSDDKSDEVVQSGCGLGSASLCLLPDKTIMACRKYKDSILGKWSVRSGFLHYFLYNSKMVSYRQLDSYGKCKKCTYLKYCRGCMAASHSYGNINYHIDPQCWID